MSQAMKIKPFWCFNSRSHVGSNPTASGASNDSMTFQLTLPRRERYDTFGTSRHITNLRFNSRSHVGSDYIVKLLYKEVRSFNSCSHVGSNDKSNHKICEPKSFQLTLPRRERWRTNRFDEAILSVSIHAPT